MHKVFMRDSNVEKFIHETQKTKLFMQITTHILIFSNSFSVIIYHTRCRES